MLCLYVCQCTTCMVGAWGGQQRALRTGVAFSWEPPWGCWKLNSGFTGRAVDVLNHWDTSLVLTLLLLVCFISGRFCCIPWLQGCHSFLFVWCAFVWYSIWDNVSCSQDGLSTCYIVESIIYPTILRSCLMLLTLKYELENADILSVQLDFYFLKTVLVMCMCRG